MRINNSNIDVDTEEKRGYERFCEGEAEGLIFSEDKEGDEECREFGEEEGG